MMTQVADAQIAITRRLPVGAEVQPRGGVYFRVWAPRCESVEVYLESSPDSSAPLAPLAMAAEADGYFSGYSPGAGTGTRYGFRLDGDNKAYPDPASRRQPDGPHGLSEVVDPGLYRWHDRGWKGVSLKGKVIYEAHVGTFTREGTWNAMARELAYLAELGVTLLEIMPVAEFAGRFGWGYDGVDLFAPSRLYGTPDDLRRLVDAAHGHGLGVMLDVVYNHFGPSGNYLKKFSDDYFSTRHRTDWGDAINFDGERSAAVREFIVANAGYWIDEFHFDGLRLDAIHAIVDESAESIMAAVARRVREAAGNRETLVIAEDESQDARSLRHPGLGGRGLDAAWNDDFHHAARVAMTGSNDCYLGDYRGTPQELIAAVKWGYLYQGQWNVRQERHRGSQAFDIEAPRFVVFLQNHDQVANSPQGRRIHQLTSPGRHRAMTVLMALVPGTPLLFQGQEFSASGPFLYFADHEPELGKLVRAGREAWTRQFRRQAGADVTERLDDPGDPATFEKSKLDFADRDRNVQVLALHRELFRLRREDRVFAEQAAERIHGSVLAGEAFLLRYFGDAGHDRLLLVNLGRDLEYCPATDPLLAPPAGRSWRLLLSSEDPRFGGLGTGLLDPRMWYVPGHATLVLTAESGE